VGLDFSSLAAMERLILLKIIKSKQQTKTQQLAKFSRIKENSQKLEQNFSIKMKMLIIQTVGLPVQKIKWSHSY